MTFAGGNNDVHCARPGARWSDEVCAKVCYKTRAFHAVCKAFQHIRNILHRLSHLDGTFLSILPLLGFTLQSVSLLLDILFIFSLLDYFMRLLWQALQSKM